MKDGEEVCDMKVFDYDTWQMKTVKDVALKSHQFDDSVFPLCVCWCYELKWCCWMNGVGIVVMN